MQWLEGATMKVLDGYLWLTDAVAAHPHRAVWASAALILAALVF